MEDLENYYGRRFTRQQVPKEILKYASSQESMSKEGRFWICGRCHLPVSQNDQLPNGHVYCRKCIIFGRNESHSQLYFFPAKPFPVTNALEWQGQLTVYQEELSRQLLKYSNEKQRHLVHAVTGAGKTEMIYALIASYLNVGKWVCIASPRVDVCIELYRRLKRDFSCPISLMYGGAEPYQRSPLIIATTHQLLKFYKAFDLLIVDEVDSFPFEGNKMLQQGLISALKSTGELLYLTATSTKALDKKVANGEIEKLTLARRFHNQPLIVPRFKLMLHLEEQLQKQKIPYKLVKLIQNQRTTNYPLLIFYPIIEKGREFCQLLEGYFKEEKISYISSYSKERDQIVEDFRQGEFTILVTTTILERGVTFPGIDVFVILAQHKLFHSSSLIQIAGRVGRSLDRPTGQLLFIHQGVSLAMLKARKEIIAMNHEAYGE